MRSLLVAAVAATASLVLPAAPSSAAGATLPSCVVALPNAAAGTSASCASDLPGLGNSTFGAYRTIYLVAVTGTARATVSCQTAPLSGSLTATGPDTVTAGSWGAGVCTLTLTALTDGTNATATLIGSYAGTI